MTPTIETLEKEIAQFHESISGSNELLAALNDVVSVTKEQTAAFDAKTDELRTALAQLPNEVKDDVADCIQSFVAEVQAEQDRYEGKISDILNEYVKTISETENQLAGMPKAVRDEMDGVVEETNRNLLSVQQQYADRLAMASSQFAEKVNVCIAQLDEKYSAFLAILDANNADQLYQLSEKMNRSLNLKMNLALGGVALAIILAIIGLFI